MVQLETGYHSTVNNRDGIYSRLQRSEGCGVGRTTYKPRTTNPENEQ